MENTITLNPNDMINISDNLEAALKDGKLILVIDVTKTIGLSSTGKMMGVASTGGFTALPGNLKGNVYIGKKA